MLRYPILLLLLLLSFTLHYSTLLYATHGQTNSATSILIVGKSSELCNFVVLHYPVRRVWLLVGFILAVYVCSAQAVCNRVVPNPSPSHPPTTTNKNNKTFHVVRLSAQPLPLILPPTTITIKTF
jgi:hypothetical protein